MIKSLRNNPILIYQMRHARWPSPSTALAITIVLTIVGLALTIEGYVVHPDGISLIPIFIMLIEALLFFFGPLLMAIVSVIATGRAINSEVYQMIRLSQLAEHRIIKGYVAGAMFHLRAMWMVAGGLMLPLIVALTHVGVAFQMFMYVCKRIGSPTGSDCPPSESSVFFIQQVGIALMLAVCAAALFIAWNGLAATLGVWLAFRLRRTGWALVGVLLFLVVFIAVQVFLIFLAVGMPCVLLIFSMANLALVGVAYQEAVRTCEKHSRMSKGESLLFGG